MGTISDKLMRIINTKEDIRQALISKGYDVPTSIPFKEYAKMISDLPCRVDSFPDIEGIVARYSALGLTNEQMKENPVWVDKTGNGHDLQMKNFIWGGMSGIGGYNQNFNQWGYGNLPPALQTYTPHKVELNIPSTLKTGNIYSNLGKEGDIYDFTLKIVGLKDGASLRITKGVVSGNIERIEKDGIYKIYQPLETSWDQLRIYIVISNPNLVDLNITIEQLPLYPGALVFDGVDDYGTCDNFPILTKEKGYTVVALRKWLTPETKTINEVLLGNFKNNPIWISANLGAFQFEVKYNVSKKVQTGSFGIGNNITLNNNHLFSYQISNSYNGSILRLGSDVGGNFFTVGCGGDQFYANAAIWELVFLDHDATEEELTKIKDYFVKTYPWLFPDQAWIVTGKTNEDEDRATIANITGNGNDLVLSNFGFAEGSGYGLYYQYFGNEFKATNGEIEGGGWNIIDNYNISHDKRIPINSIGKCFWGNKALVNGIKLRFKLTGMTEGDVLAFGYAATYDLTYTSDGIYAIDLPPVDKSYGFSLQSSLTENLPTTPVTIELLPFEYEGYLVTDGVDDKVQSSSFTMNEDWTIVGDWELLSNVQINCGIVKAQNVYLYNIANGLLISINNPRSLQSFGTKSFHAICSDGRLYDRNWVEYKYTADQNFSIVESSLNIGFNLNNYTQMAFKNLGIYNNQLLSKDDCIKAYNYLQTLKSK